MMRTSHSQETEIKMSQLMSRTLLKCYSKTVANNFGGVGSITEVPVIQFDNDECTSTLDFFEHRCLYVPRG